MSGFFNFSASVLAKNAPILSVCPIPGLAENAIMSMSFGVFVLFLVLLQILL